MDRSDRPNRVAGLYGVDRATRVGRAVAQPLGQAGIVVARRRQSRPLSGLQQDGEPEH
jgi:hypothetical protein